VLSERQCNVLRARLGIEQRRVLKDHRAFLSDSVHLDFIEMGYVLVVEPDLTIVGSQKPDEVLDEHALPDAGRADDEKHFALSNIEAHTVEHDFVAERLLDVDERNHRFSRAPSAMGDSRKARESRSGFAVSYRKAALAARPAIAVMCGLLWQGCGSGSKRPAVSPHDARAALCAVNQTREFYCDDLLPLSAALPAPAPYETCPSSIETAVGQYEPPPKVALFDSSYTEYIRKRAPPGHACCYSWCSSFKLGDPRSPTAQTNCTTATAFREQYCMSEPEQGTSSPAVSPFDKCAMAVVPPAKAVFSVPEAALFDPSTTASKRKGGENDCCYAWCSQAPPGSGLQGGAPKKKK